MEDVNVQTKFLKIPHAIYRKSHFLTGEDKNIYDADVTAYHSDNIILIEYYMDDNMWTLYVGFSKVVTWGFIVVIKNII